MAYKDLHEDPFDETTIAKLEIFEDYAQAWIPTFVMQGAPTICIFDFFAGTGYDKNGVAGSSIRILEKIKEQIGYIFQKNVKIKVYLNEFEPNKKEQKKFQLLQIACNEFLEVNKDVKRAIEKINYFNEDFETLFPKLISEIKLFPSLVYLDQNGIKFLSDKYLLELEKLSTTDFLYYVSSSYFKWLGETEEFKKHVDLDIELLRNNPYRFIHRNVIEQLRKKLPSNSKLKLYPFSLKKGANIFGIVFGAKHPLAVDKFLNIAWKRNPVNGDANFDIDEDTTKGQIDLWGNKRKTKIEEFKENLKAKVLANEIKNNFEALLFVYDEGHIGNHAAEVLRELKKKGEINYDGISPLVTYDNVFKNHKKVEYKSLKK
ncbi:MAG TPA: three-Cys-motif partner protein TcmP [Bacteroidia bacterium]|nr:three-Cys-motif partner protein TcmP [Bacteroidia bacterium]